MIIKCPECGHQVSDKAPVCPSCGVEIAGHIIKCSHCGELYLKEETSCPNCHHTESHFEPSENTTEQNSNKLSNEQATAAPTVVVHDEVGIHRLFLVFILLLGSLFVVRWFGHYDLHWYLFFS